MLKSFCAAALTRRGIVAPSLLVGALASTVAHDARAQVGDVSWVVYPGWIPSDRVGAIVGVSTTYDALTQLWTYSYRLMNRSWGEQPIIKLDLDFQTAKSNVTTPTGWNAIVGAPGDPRAGVGYSALLASGTMGSSPNGPAAAQVEVNNDLDGFGFTSAYPPGYARAFVQGYAPIPYLPVDYDGDIKLPDDSTNSQRVWVPAPMKYTTVRSPGGVQAGVEGFVGFMNMDTLGTVQETPAIVALKFSLNGETVYRETLHATLNGDTVTAEFLPGPEDGAHRVALFFNYHSPIVIGQPNVLAVSVEGLIPGTNTRATDTDTVRFIVTDSRIWMVTSTDPGNAQQKKFRVDVDIWKKPKKPKDPQAP